MQAERTVYACVRVIAETIASLPAGRVRNHRRTAASKATDHPLYRLLHDEPNGGDDQLCLAGDDADVTCSCGATAYSAGHPERTERHILALYPLLPDQYGGGPGQQPAT